MFVFQSWLGTLEKYFELSTKQCKQALDMYKLFIQQMELVEKFLKVAEVSSACMDASRCQAQFSFCPDMYKHFSHAVLC